MEKIIDGKKVDVEPVLIYRETLKVPKLWVDQTSSPYRDLRTAENMLLRLGLIPTGARMAPNVARVWNDNREVMSRSQYMDPAKLWPTDYAINDPIQAWTYPISLLTDPWVGIFNMERRSCVEVIATFTPAVTEHLAMVLLYGIC